MSPLFSLGCFLANAWLWRRKCKKLTLSKRHLLWNLPRKSPLFLPWLLTGPCWWWGVTSCKPAVYGLPRGRWLAANSLCLKNGISGNNQGGFRREDWIKTSTTVMTSPCWVSCKLPLYKLLRRKWLVVNSLQDAATKNNKEEYNPIKGENCKHCGFYFRQVIVYNLYNLI